MSNRTVSLITELSFYVPSRSKILPKKLKCMKAQSVGSRRINTLVPPRGIFELKFFFSTAIGGEDGGATHSSESVKARIKTLIDEEDPKKVLSDDKIVQILKDENIDIARRTVAKYRESLHLGSSVQRRKQKKKPIILSPSGAIVLY